MVLEILNLNMLYLDYIQDVRYNIVLVEYNKLFLFLK